MPGDGAGICTSQRIDTSDKSPAGKLQLAVLMAVAEFERVKSRLASAKTRGVRLGRPTKLKDRTRRFWR